MKRLTLTAAVVLILAGCNQPATTAEATQAPAAPQASAAPAAACEPQATGYQWLPEGLVLDIPYHLRADRIYINKNNVQRRRVVLEFLDGDAESTLASVDKSMTTAGFTARPRKDQPNGNIVVPYMKKGFGGITVIASATAGDKPSNPAAKGTITFDLPATTPVAMDTAQAVR